MEEHNTVYTEAYTFLFDADNEAFDGYYGAPCGEMLFSAVLSLQQPVCTRLFAGDLVLAQHCQQITAVKKSSTQNGYTLHMDNDLYVSILTELVSSIKERDNFIVVPNIAMTLGKHNIFSITLGNITDVAWQDVCQKLMGATGFVASFQLDMGNPLHTDLFIHSLIAHGFLYGNELNILQLPFEDQEELIPLWIQDQPDIQVRFMDLDDFEKRCPQMPTAEDLSSAGSRYVELMEKKGEPNLYQRLAYALLHNDDIADCDFTISGSFSWEQVNIPENKLTKYALNMEHEGSGKGKAKLFQQLLNITKDDWRYLAAQIENAIEYGTLQNVRQTEHGVQFHIDIPIKGLNDVSRIVRTAWIIRQPQQCSLTTAYILDKSQQTEAEGEQPLIVQDTNPELFCSLLYGYASGAGERAAKNCVPTPMYIHGYNEPIMDGAAGFAWVVIHDARKQFPRWLKKHQIGHLRYNGGWAVHAKGCGQSSARAKAYANAFAKVLRQNGIDCTVESRLD
ncbi:MAG: hypothetical protein IJX01_04395 [Oscillospiraceae bacterium]|nr:hypothetical protein [Oscillospiraceae bacterium]